MSINQGWYFQVVARASSGEVLDLIVISMSFLGAKRQVEESEIKCDVITVKRGEYASAEEPANV